MAAKKKIIVIEYARMWPREVFDIIEERKLTIKEILNKRGVYVLYRDEHPYYIGKAKSSLFKRLHDHANKSTDKYFNLRYFNCGYANCKQCGSKDQTNPGSRKNKKTATQSTEK